MPTRPKSHRPTGAPGRAGQDRRLSPCKRGYTRAWERTRKAFLAANPTCHDCESEAGGGIVVPAVHVHHKRKVKDAPHLLHDHGNLLALCHACHSRRTARGE